MSTIMFLIVRVKVKDGKFDELTEILAWYDLINDVILDHLDEEITAINQSGVWRYLLSFKVFYYKTEIIFL